MDGMDFGWLMNALAEPWPPAPTNGSDGEKPFVANLQASRLRKAGPSRTSMTRPEIGGAEGRGVRLVAEPRQGSAGHELHGGMSIPKPNGTPTRASCHVPPVFRGSRVQDARPEGQK